MAGKEDKNEFQTCTRAESYQSNSLQVISNRGASLSLLAISPRLGGVTATSQPETSTRALWIVMNVSVLRMKCPNERSVEY